MLIRCWSSDVCSSDLACQCDANSIRNSEKAASPTPNCNAVCGSSRPAGSGRPAVRFILASSPASYHWLSAPDAPAPSAIARIDAKASTGCTSPGAASSPHSAVNTTSDMTRGLVSANRSRQASGSACFPWVRLWAISNLYTLICVCCNLAVRPELVEGPFFLLAASKKRTVLRQAQGERSEEHTSELQSLMSIS